MSRSRPPVGAKRDANEGPIVDTLRSYGMSVTLMDRPVDLLCGARGHTYIAEIKTPKGKLTPAQTAFYSTWDGNHTILRTKEEAEEFAKMVMKRKRDE